MLPVAVGHGFLQRGIEPDYMVGDVAELIVRERFGIVDSQPFFGILGKAVKPRDVLSQSAGGEKSENTHHQSHNTHEPDKAVVGLQEAAERYGVGDGCSHHVAVLSFAGRIEIRPSRALAVAAHGESCAARQGVAYFLPPEMAVVRQRVEAVVVYHIALAVDHTHSEISEGVQPVETHIFHLLAALKLVEDIGIDNLELGIELGRLEFAFAVVLEDKEASEDDGGVAEKPEIKAPGVRDSEGLFHDEYRLKGELIYSLIYKAIAVA